MGTTSPDTAHMVDVGALSDFVPAPGRPTLALDAAADAQTLPVLTGCMTPSLNRTAPGHGPDGIHMLEVDPSAHFTSGGSLAGCLDAHGDGARGAVQRGGAERGGWTGAEPIVVFRTRAGGLFAIQVCPLFHRLSCPIVRGPSSRLRDHLCVQMRCPHQGSSLANGDIADIEDLPEEVSRAAASGCAESSAAGAWVSCPSHGFVFDLRTGSNPFRPVGAREARPAFHSELYHH